MTEPTALRLIAETPEDLEVIAAAVQDAVIKARNLNFESRQRRFTLEMNRFAWEAKETNDEKVRVRSLLAIDGVLAARTRAITKADPELILSILHVSFEPAEDPPGGKVTLLFAGDGEIVLDVEVLDVTLLDSGYVWPTRHTPSHEPRNR